MSSTKTNSNDLPINCIADENSNCAECDLDGNLMCFVDKKFANKFTIGNITYRILALAIFVFSGLLIGHWWMLISYGITVVVTFTIIEPRLLCSHCPYYEKEGKCLKCWALRGMPKLWKYRPEPINRTERILMLIIGGYIDLFPFVGAIWGIVIFANNHVAYLGIGIGLVIVTLLFIIIAGYFSQVLLGNACKRCANFSCAMNKVSKDIVDKFLEKNPKMRESWIACGWQIE